MLQLVAPPAPETKPRRTPKRRVRALRPYQKAALAYCRANPHAALLLEMRLGKTLITIRALQHSPGRILVVAPGSALGAWLDELRLEGIPETEIGSLIGTARKRHSTLSEGRRWNLLNREGWRALPEIQSVPWGAVVVDESTALKNPKAGITKFYLRNFRRVPRRFILTGTVAPESDLDVYCQLAFLYGAAFGCANYWGFLARYFYPAPTGYGWLPKTGTAGAVRRYLAERAFILRRKDVQLDVPKVRERRRLTLPPKWAKVYRRVESEFLLPGTQRETKYAVTKYHWLRQLCGGFLDGKLVWPGKLEELVNIFRCELAGTPAVVWFYYNAELFAAAEALGKAGVSFRALYGALPHERRREIVEAFQGGGFQLLLAQQAVAQMGVNLSHADTAVYYSTPLGALGRAQTEDRILDVTRKSPLLILDLVVGDTVDEDATELVLEKTARGAWTLERARALAKQRMEKYADTKTS